MDRAWELVVNLHEANKPRKNRSAYSRKRSASRTKGTHPSKNPLPMYPGTGLSAKEKKALKK